MTDANETLPLSVAVTEAFSQRLPSQRVLDQLAAIEGVAFGELVQHQPFRIVAFRALLRDYPTRDATSLWLHSYDVECEVVAAVDPTHNGSMTPAPGSAALTP